MSRRCFVFFRICKEQIPRKIIYCKQKTVSLEDFLVNYLVFFGKMLDTQKLGVVPVLSLDLPPQKKNDDKNI